MKSFKALSFKEKMEYIGILAIYPLILLYEQLGKSVKFLNSRKRQITASVLTVCLMLTMIPVMSLTASAESAPITETTVNIDWSKLSDVVVGETVPENKFYNNSNSYSYTGPFTVDSEKVYIEDEGWASIPDKQTEWTNSTPVYFGVGENSDNHCGVNGAKFDDTCEYAYVLDLSPKDGYTFDEGCIINSDSDNVTSIYFSSTSIAVIFPLGTVEDIQQAAPHTHDDVTFEPWTATDSLPTTSGNYYLVNDVTLAESYDVPENVSVNLCLNDRVINAVNESHSMEVSKDASLAIYDCGTTVRSYTENELRCHWELDEVFDNTETEKLTTGGIITGMLYNGALLNGGTLTINGGNIVGNGDNDYWCTVRNAENATLVINGGNIVGNYGDYGIPIIGNFGTAILNSGIIAHNNTNYATTGVIFNAGGTFTMNGGSVIENISERGVLNYSSFIMTGGEIAHNYVYPESEGIGIHNWEGTVALSGGVIHDNTDTLENTNLINDVGELTDLLADGYVFYDKDGNEIAPENLATAEYLEVKLAPPPHTHTGVTGEFTEWTAKSGTVSTSGNYYLADNITATGDITVSEGAVVNLCLNGKKLNLNSHTIKVKDVKDGATLNMCDCQSTETKGHIDSSSGLWKPGSGEKTANLVGGVIYGSSASAIYIERATFNMSGGNIAGNTGDFGGGVFVDSDATFNMSGGSILYNSAYYGGGVCQFSTMNITGEVDIRDNKATEWGNNLYLGGKRIITVSAKPKNPIGISTYTLDLETSPADVTTENSSDISSYFFSDRVGYRLVNGENNVLQLEYTSSHFHSDGQYYTAISKSNFEKFGQISGTYVCLDQNITANQNIGINVDTLCLNGYTFDLGNYTLRFMGNVTVCDCYKNPGKITSENSGEIFNRGTLTLADGAQITGDVTLTNELNNTLNITGGVINLTETANIDNEGTLNMSGGSVTGMEYGIKNTGTIYLSGSPSISGGADYSDLCNNTGKIYAQSSDGTTAYTGEPLRLEVNSPSNGQVAVYNADIDSFSLVNTDGYILAANNGNLILAFPHTHSWATDWTSNATHHWHECTADGCEVTVNSEKNGYGEHDYTGDYTCDCGLHSHDNITFDKEWTAKSGTVSTSGNYYLADNITATGNITIASGTEVTLCLNGYTLDLGSKKITVSSGATLSICDCSEGESGVIKSTHRAALNSSDRYSDTAGAINVFGNVTISSGTVQNDCQYGRAIYVGSNANLTVSGGKVAITNNGHYAVFVGNNTLFGTDPAGTFTMTGGLLDTGTGYGSGTGVYICNGAVATVTGGKIQAGGGSQAIINYDSTLIIGGDAVINSTDEYSAIWVNANGSSATAVLHISGGTITAPNSEAAVSIANGNGDTVVYLSGNPTITGKDSDISISVKMDGTIKTKFYAVSEDGNTAYSGEALRLYLNGAHRVQSGEVVVRNSTDTEKFTLTNGGYKLEQSGENLAIATYGYNLWVGGVYVTEDNASDIFGNGTASYNAETQTLYLENAVISGSYTPEDLDYAAGIYSSHALNILISGTVDILVQSSNYGIGILVDGDLNIAKDPDNSSVTLNVIGDFAAVGCLSGDNITYDGLTVKGSAEIDAQNAPTEEVALSDGIFFAGSDIAKMLQFTYTAPHTHAGIDGNFTGLADADLESGTLYTNNYFLGCDLTVSINGEIVIPSDQEVIICLNGHDIDLGESQITNKGKLIICDCTDKSGTITSENTSVAIKNSGSLTVSDVTVSSSSERTVDNDGSLTVTGGAVISGGDSAVYNAKSKTAIISGNSTITSASGYAIQNKGKLYLSSKLTVSGADSMADIYISDTASEIYATDVAGGVAFSGNVLTMKTLSTVTSGVVVYGINNNNAEKFTLVEDSPYVLIRGIGTNKNNLIIDITAPTGKISIGTNHWEDFLDKDVFGLFFKEYKYIEITGSDAESGIKSREYYLSETPVSFEAVKKSEIQWITYSGKVKIEPNNKYFIYAKITDNAGNVAYIDTDGIALDNVAPAFSVTVGADTFDDNIGRYYFITGEKEQSYTVEDGLAGVEKVEYLDSAEELDDAELGKATGWQKLNNGDKLPYVNGTVYNRYYRAIDKAGNASYVYLGVVVCYTDYKGEAFTADYTYGSREDVLVEMELDDMQLWVYRYIALLDKLSFTDGTNTYNDNYSFYDLTSKQGFGLKLPDGKIPESILENDNTVTSITLSVKPIVTAGTDFYGDIPSALPIKIIIKPTDGKVESISDISKTYDGTAVNAPTYDKLGNGTVTVEYKVKGAEDASYTTTAPINAGEYTVRVSVEASQPYKSTFATKDFKIEKATPIIGEVSVSGPDSIYFNTELNSIILDRTDKSIAGELKLAAGQTLTVGTQNYNWCFEPNDSRNYKSVNGSVSVTVVKLDPTVIWPDDLVGNAGEKLSTVTLIGDNFAWDNGDEVIVYGNDTTYKMVYTPDDIINYNVIYKQVAVDGLDVTLPTGEITLKDNKWNEFLNNITLGLFFKETQSIAITADDTESGVKEIAYYLATEELAKEAVKEIENSEWTVYADAFNIEPDNKYVVYVRITDNAGNITYINSDGIVLDSIKPIISGVEDGKDVYGDATFTVDELYLDTVTLDGEPIEVVNGKYSVPADNKEHTIVVTDKTGNQVTYKLTVYKNYKVSFVIDGKEIEVSEVGYGKNATLPEIPKKNGYTAKWDASGKNITADTVITAVYKKISQPQSPQTGDNTNIWLWVAVMFVSGFSLFGAIITKKRKEKEAE